MDIDQYTIFDDIMVEFEQILQKDLPFSEDFQTIQALRNDSSLIDKLYEEISEY